MKGRLAGSALLVLSVVILLHLYIGWNLYVYLQHMTGGGWGAGAGTLFWIVFWLVVFMFPLSMMVRRYVPLSVSGFMKLLGGYWMAVLVYAVLLVPLGDLAALALHASGVEPDVYVRWIGSIVLAAVLLIVIRGSWNARMPVVRTYDIHINKKAGGLSGLKVAVGSDFHLGTVVGRKHLRKFITRVNAMQPDLILLAGDVLDDDVTPFMELQMGDMLKELQSTYGTYAVLGNHEYYGGGIPTYIKEMKRVGIEVLTDCAVRIEDSFYVVGRKDITSETSRGIAMGADPGRLPLEPLLAEIDRKLPVILMDHQPYALDKAAAAGVDVMLSGHTHRAQMAPLNLITRRLFELDWGFKKKGNLHAVVSSGFGTWGPRVRIGSRSEIVELRIRFDE